MKDELKHIPMILVLIVLCYGIITLADNYLFNSSDVKYNNTTSGVQSGDVQGAIDELYACASNYAAYNNRLTNAENTIGNSSLTTTSQTLIGAINGLNDQIGNKQGKYTAEHIVYRGVDIGTNYGYTGKSVTIPAYKIFGIYVNEYYNGAWPTGIALSSSSTSLQAWTSIISEVSSTVSMSGYNAASNSITFYIWAKASTSGSNDITVDYWYM